MHSNYQFKDHWIDCMKEKVMPFCKVYHVAFSHCNNVLSHVKPCGAELWCKDKHYSVNSEIFSVQVSYCKPLASGHAACNKYSMCSLLFWGLQRVGQSLALFCEGHAASIFQLYTLHQSTKPVQSWRFRRLFPSLSIIVKNSQKKE